MTLHNRVLTPNVSSERNVTENIAAVSLPYNTHNDGLNGNYIL